MYSQDPDGATPVDPDEAEGLLPAHVVTRDELNAWEQQNILEAVRWSQRTTRQALDELAVRELHRRMFDRTWAWAGTYRRSDKNIGVYWADIPAEVVKVIDDGRYWITHGTYPLNEAALRLHHRIVRVHLFPNGNGRHARLWADMILEQNGQTALDWRNPELDSASEMRGAYLDALRAADANDYEPLLGLYLGRE